jgi:hypothetical protein
MAEAYKAASDFDLQDLVDKAFYSAAVGVETIALMELKR